MSATGHVSTLMELYVGQAECHTYVAPGAALLMSEEGVPPVT